MMKLEHRLGEVVGNPGESKFSGVKRAEVLLEKIYGRVKRKEHEAAVVDILPYELEMKRKKACVEERMTMIGGRR